MIDLHCHLFPGMDDGPRELGDAVELARLSVENGITHAVVTPHITPGRYDNDLFTISTAYQAFKQVLNENEINLNIGMAAEVRLGPEIFTLFEDKKLPFLGEFEGRKVLLLEFPHDHIPPGSDKMVKWLFDHNIIPMIAHPERNKDILRKISKLQPFVEAGCLLQITASSLVGNFGPHSEQCAKTILQKGWVTILASDAHNLHKRLPEIEPGRAVVEEMLGKEVSWKMVRDKPWEIASNHF
ncbi:MAG: capsular biosynthesis protein [Proteobacteria bacterium]|nr:capsular biosynthesis protein [Pseudomonadota bacterium]